MNASSDAAFQTILADCLDAVLSGQETISGCLARFPQYASELKPLLEAGVLTTRMRSPELPATQVDALEARLRAQMVAQTPHHKTIMLPGVRLAAGRLAAIIAIAFLVFFGSSAGLVAASANTVPGDTLYSVKRFWEEIILLLTTLVGNLDELWLHFAQVRLEEVVTISEQGHLTTSALTDLYTATINAVQNATPEDQAKVMAFMEHARVTLTPLARPKELEATFTEVLALMTPVFDDQNRLQVPQLVQPPHLNTPAIPSSPTPTATVVIVDTATWTPQPTATPTASVTRPPSATATWTPRFPETATHTPTFTMSPTWTLTPTPTPTSTWTPLPLPELPTNDGTAVLPPTAGHTNPVSPTPGPTLDVTARMRETQRSVYLTQTAGPQDTPGP
ncbi:MAG: hypothetical protein H6672_01615 [Anaerolineaceae bacterium]|nr:hypothetical protein [Anaerolineaceae bacterium]